MVRIEPSQDDAAASFATREQLARGFKRLRPEQQRRCPGHHLDLAVPESAEVLGIPIGTTKSRIHYAMEVLRAALEADERDTVVATNGRTASTATRRSRIKSLRGWPKSRRARTPDRLLGPYSKTRAR